MENKSSGAENIKDILHTLRSKIKGEEKKIKVDPDDILADALKVYKSQSFDPTCPLVVRYKHQPAVDTGGVLREFYSGVFKEFVNDPSVQLFQGPQDRLLFNYNQTALTCGMPKMLGNIVAHSLCQNGPGFPYLSPCQYYYVATGDVTRAIAYATIHDVLNPDIKAFINQILSSRKDDLQDINKNPAFQDIMSDCGMTCLVTENNKLVVVQSIIGHYAVVCKVPMLEQFAAGLKTLGVIDAIRRYPTQFLEFFVHSTHSKTPCFLKGLLKLRKSGENGKCVEVFNMLLQFVDECSEEDISQFLKYTTGCSDAFPSVTDEITVEISSDATAIFASTCLFKLVLPESMADESYELFKASIAAVLDENGKSFSVP